MLISAFHCNRCSLNLALAPLLYCWSVILLGLWERSFGRFYATADFLQGTKTSVWFLHGCDCQGKWINRLPWFWIHSNCAAFHFTVRMRALFISMPLPFVRVSVLFSVFNLLNSNRSAVWAFSHSQHLIVNENRHERKVSVMVNAGFPSQLDLPPGEPIGFVSSHFISQQKPIWTKLIMEANVRTNLKAQVQTDTKGLQMCFFCSFASTRLRLQKWKRWMCTGRTDKLLSKTTVQ